MNQLKLEHISPYLPYQLKYKDCYGNIGTLRKIEVDSPSNSRVDAFNHGGLGLFNLKPFLRPLSDLNNEIEHNGEKFTPYDWLEEKYYTLDLHKQCEIIIEDYRWINHCEYGLIQHLLEWHFDIYNLLEDGLAINFNQK